MRIHYRFQPLRELPSTLCLWINAILLLIIYTEIISCTDKTIEIQKTETLTKVSIDSLQSPYTFPITIGSIEWRGLKTGQEMLNVCQIPEEVLGLLSTPALCETCMNFPLAYDYIFSNDEKLGFFFYLENFNGLKELSQRDDAFLPIITEYGNAHYEPLPKSQYGIRNNNFFHIGYIELILASDPFYEHFSKKQILLLKETALEKYNYELENIDIFGVHPIRRTLMLIAKCIVSANTLGPKDKSILEDYIQRYQTIDADKIEEISKIITTN